MALATYVSDLALITLFESTSGIGNFGGGGGAASAGIDYAIEGTNAVDKQVNATERGFLFTAAGDFTIGADDHFYIWVVVGTYGLADTRDNRGICVAIGDGTGDFVQFHMNGGDTLPLGGMIPYAVRFVNTALTNLRTLVGTPDTAPDSIGCTANITGSAKFANLAADACRIGTGYDILNGTGADPEADFAGIAADDVSTREGILLSVDGGFKLQGKLRIGSGATACEFLDSNTNIFIADTFHSLADFNEILIEHASSIVTLSNINFTGLGTNSPGRLEVLTAAATLTFVNVGFIDFGETVLGSGSSLIGCRWIGSGIITANEGDLAESSVSGFEGAANTSPLIWDTSDPDGNLDGMKFVKGASATHAIEFGDSIPASITLRDCDFQGYNGTQDQDDSIFHFKDTTGTITINLIGCTSDVSFATAFRTDGATIVVVNDPVTVAITVLDDVTGNPIATVAHVMVMDADAGPPFTEIDSGAVNGSGIFSFSYSGVTPKNIEGWAREMDESGTDYVPRNFSGTIEAGSGFSITLRLTPLS